MGIMAASTVHWLMLLDTRFMSAIGAWVTRRAQENAETFSGNSERNGATHWTSTNWLTPNSPATASIDSRNGWAVAYSSPPPVANSPPIGARRRAEQRPEVGGVERQQDHRVDPADALPQQDDAEIQERRHQPHDLDRVLGFEPDGG